MNALYERLWYMLTGWGSIALVYGLTSSQDQTAGIMLKPTVIDLWFDFNPDTIWIYLSFFLLVPLAYLICQRQYLIWLARSMQLSAFGAGIIFIAFPTTMEFPEVTQNGFNADMLRLLISYDLLLNCLPSLHVTLTILAVWTLWEKGHLLRNIIITAWGIAITVSILQLYRHQFVDAVAGAILACLAGWLTQIWLTAKTESCKENPPTFSG